MRLGSVLVLGMLCSTLARAEQSLVVPVEPSNNYSIASIKYEKIFRTVIIKRETPDRTTYSERVFDCEKGMSKLLAIGSTVESLENNDRRSPWEVSSDAYILKYIQPQVCAIQPGDETNG